MIDVKINNDYPNEGFKVAIITNSGKQYFTIQSARELKSKLDIVLIELEQKGINKLNNEK